MITLCYVYDLISFYKQQGITMCKYWCNWPIIGATLAQCIMPRPGKYKMLTQSWPNSGPFKPTLHVRYHNECILTMVTAGNHWRWTMDYPVNTWLWACGCWMWASEINVIHTDQCEPPISNREPPHKSMWATQINVSHIDLREPHRSMWATQINVSHTGQCQPHRLMWATQINMSHTDQYEPHWSMPAT